jgi:hypothetical protein
MKTAPMTFDLIKGSGNRVMSTVRIDERNAITRVWWCEGKQEWHWSLVWEDGGPWGTHMHNGIAPTSAQARADIAKTILWIEDKWPTLEYFENNR